jgi:putative aminopeptidase
MTSRRSVTRGVRCAMVAIATFSMSGQSQPPPADALALLIRAQGVSGFETSVREVLTALLPAPGNARTDETGNLIVTLGQGRPHVLITTAVDEDGYIVSRIMNDGYLRLQRVTTGVTNRLFDQFHYGQPVLIRTRTGALVAGVIGSASQHLQRGREQSTAIKGLDDLWVDVGAESEADVAKTGIRLLDTVALRDRVQFLANGRVAGVAGQGRANALALVSLLHSLGRSTAPAGTLTVAWAAQGSFGERGFTRLAQEIDADRVILVSRSTVPKDANAKGASGVMGAGPLVPESDTQSLEAARQANVPAQAVPPSMLRTPTSWPAAKLRVLGLPVLFMQTPVETLDMADVAAMTALLRVLVGLPAQPASPVALPALPSPPRMPPAAEHDIFRILRPLIETYGVSGHEAPVRERVAGLLPKWAKPEIDEGGNLTVRFGQGGTTLAFVAHLDELGYEITAVLDDGTATVRNRGGMSDMGHEAHPMLVHSAKGAVPAVVAPRPNYLRAEEGRPRPEEIALYFGTATRADTEALGVAKGDSVTVRKSLVPLGPNRATARSIDDRNGVAALLAAINRIDPAGTPNTVTFSWVVGEEIGLVGSAFVAPRLRPAYVFAVDTFVSSDSPLDPQRLAHVPLGTGAVARAVDNSSITPPETVARIVEIARARKIPISVGTTNGGNDGSSFSRYGTIVAPLSWPGRYSHSPVEVMDVRDLEALVQLIVGITSEPRFSR